MTPSGLVSAATFLIVIPTALMIRLLTLLNLNAVVLYYPSGLSSHENRPLIPSDNNPTLKSGLMEQPADFLPSWLSHVLKDHSLSKSTSQWKGRGIPIIVSINLTVDFAQPPLNDLFDQTVTINTAEPNPQKGRPQAISPSNTTTHLHGKINSDDHGGYEPREEMPFQSVVFANLLVHPLGLALVFFAWRQASRLRSSYHSFLRMIKNARVIVSFRNKECTKDQEDAQVPPYENIVSKESSTYDYPPTHVESSIREWTPEDDYETDVTNIAEPDAITLLLRDLIAGFREPHVLGIGPDSSTCSEAPPHFGPVSCDESNCTFVDAEAMTCPPDHKISSSHRRPSFGFSRSLLHHTSAELHHPLSPAKVLEPGTLGTLDLCTVGDDRRNSSGVSESEYFTNVDLSFVYSQLDFHHSHRETSLIHIPRRSGPQCGPQAVTSRELTLYLRYPRAWEADDLAAAWRCFAESRRGKRWIAYGTVGIVVLLQAVLASFLSSGS